MTNETTRIEMVTEAIEGLALAVVVATLPGGDAKSQAIHHQNVLDARACVADALKELVAPVLRTAQSLIAAA